MGWYFSPQSRSELIAELIAPQETERASVKVIAHALRGNVPWSVAASWQIEMAFAARTA